MSSCLSPPGPPAKHQRTHKTQLTSLQVYGFSVATTPTYKGYDWSLLTTSAWRTDPALIDLAKQHDARVEINAGNVANVMGDTAKRKQWVCAPLAKPNYY